jgi:hypothetical protein
VIRNSAFHIDRPHRHNRPPLNAILVFSTILALAVGWVNAPAFASSVEKDPAVHCQVVLGKATSSTEGSPIVSTKCVHDGEQLMAPASSTLLAIAWDQYNFSGASLNIYGNDGPCDGEGYGIRNVGFIYAPGTHPGDWNDRIRSWRVFNRCDYSSAFRDQDFGGYCGEYKGPVADGSYLDGGITSMWFSACCRAWDVC